ERASRRGEDRSAIGVLLLVLLPCFGAAAGGARAGALPDHARLQQHPGRGLPLCGAAPGAAGVASLRLATLGARAAARLQRAARGDQRARAPAHVPAGPPLDRNGRTGGLPVAWHLRAGGVPRSV
ncbi:MAG: hypothetical protein AVDCRST_MAG77-283, partial [uncultured Chloroflexi bacterium]